MVHSRGKDASIFSFLVSLVSFPNLTSPLPSLPSHPDWLPAILISQSIQLLFLAGQDFLSPTFFLPARFAPPPPYDYHLLLPRKGDVEGGKGWEMGDCSICMEPIVRDELVEAGGGLGGGGGRKSWAVAPCQHAFVSCFQYIRCCVDFRADSRRFSFSVFSSAALSVPRALVGDQDGLSGVSSSFASYVDVVIGEGLLKTRILMTFTTLSSFLVPRRF